MLQAELRRRAGGSSGGAALEEAGGAGGWTALQMARRAGHEACIDAFKRHLEELQAVRREEAAAEAAARGAAVSEAATAPRAGAAGFGDLIEMAMKLAHARVGGARTWFQES